MTSLLCELCGGRLIAKSGGVYECVSCGMQYDKTRIQEMMQQNPSVQAAPAAPVKTGKSKMPIILAAAAAIVLLAVVLLIPTFQQMSKYNAAVKLMKAGEFETAIAAFEAMNGYRDSEARIEECRAGMLDAVYGETYGYALALADAGRYAEAGITFYGIREYKDAYEQSMEAWRQAVPMRTFTGNCAGIMADGTVQVLDFGSLNYTRWPAYQLDGWTDVVSISSYCPFSFDEIQSGHTIGLRADGTVIAAGTNDYGQLNVNGWQDMVDIATGWEHAVGLKADGTVVVAGGEASMGQHLTEDWRDIVAIDAGTFTTVGLRADGTVVAVGYNDYGQCNVRTWTDIVAISASGSHTVGLRADGTVVAIGNNDNGQCDVSRWKDITAIVATDHYTVGLRADGTVVSSEDWMGRGLGCEYWKDIVAISSDNCEDNLLGFQADGTVLFTQSGYDWDGIRLP